MDARHSLKAEWVIQDDSQGVVVRVVVPEFLTAGALGSPLRSPTAT